METQTPSLLSAAFSNLQHHGWQWLNSSSQKAKLSLEFIFSWYLQGLISSFISLLKGNLSPPKKKRFKKYISTKLALQKILEGNLQAKEVNYTDKNIGNK